MNCERSREAFASMPRAPTSAAACVDTLPGTSLADATLRFGWAFRKTMGADRTSCSCRSTRRDGARYEIPRQALQLLHAWQQGRLADGEEEGERLRPRRPSEVSGRWEVSVPQLQGSPRQADRGHSMNEEPCSSCQYFTGFKVATCARCAREERIEEQVEVVRRCLPLLIAAIREYDAQPPR